MTGHWVYKKPFFMNLLRICFPLFFLILITIGNSGCEGSKPKNSQYRLVDDPPFRIIESYSQNWIAGIVPGGSGTNLFITLAEVEEGVVIQELYFRGKIESPKRSISINDQYIGYFKNGGKKDIIMDADPAKESKNVPPEKIPFQLDEQEAIIGFFKDGEKLYYKLTGIHVKPPIAYPSTNEDIDK
jgi:hypothetical protein